jgi:regulator of cell morphogenesis and NO signaling
MVALIEDILKADAALADVARALPQTIAVFEEAGIDYCCKGARSLDDAAGSAGFTTGDLLAMLDAAPPNGERDWSDAPVAELMKMLLHEHRETIIDALREVRRCIDAVQATVRMAEARRLEVLASDFTNHVLAHIGSEEDRLFPAIAMLDAMAHGESAGPMPPRIAQSILRELVEHEALRDRLRTMRELACRLPDIAGGVARLRAALREFSRVVHHHIHLENNVLYPRAMDAENALRRAARA